MALQIDLIKPKNNHVIEYYFLKLGLENEHIIAINALT